MKLIRGTGRVTEIYDLPGPPLMRFVADGAPMKVNGYQIVEDVEAREIARELIRMGYRREVPA